MRARQLRSGFQFVGAQLVNELYDIGELHRRFLDDSAFGWGKYPQLMRDLEESG